MIGSTRRIVMRRLADPLPHRPAPRRRIPVLPVSVLLAVLLVGGCAGGGAADEPGGSPSQGGTIVSPSGGTIPTDPGNSGKPPRDPATEPPAKGGPTPGGPSAAMTLTGTVTAGVEPNCLLLDGYLLVGGSRDVVRAGARVSVTGRPEPGLMTTCQQGIPFRVESARAA